MTEYRPIVEESITPEEIIKSLLGQYEYHWRIAVDNWRKHGGPKPLWLEISADWNVVYDRPKKETATDERRRFRVIQGGVD